MYGDWILTSTRKKIDNLKCWLNNVLTFKCDDNIMVIFKSPYLLDIHIEIFTDEIICYLGLQNRSGLGRWVT